MAGGAAGPVSAASFVDMTDTTAPTCPTRFVPEAWLPAPEAPTLGEGEVHVWRCWLDLDSLRLAALHATLSADEEARAARYRLARDRDRYIAARGLLRAMLARYLGLPPSQICFHAEPYGKPALTGVPEGIDLRFNLAHSGALALVAVARGCEVGVDLERIRPELDHEAIAARFFAPGEVAALRTLPAAARLAAFYACWVRKEACVKARGDGLCLPLDRFQVSLAPGEPAALLHAEEPGEVARWTLSDLPAGEGYAATLATEGRAARLCLWEWA